VKWISRSLLAALALAALALVVFGPREIDPTPPGRVLVQYWEKWGGNEAIQ
jgi:hypothetical protein